MSSLFNRSAVLVFARIANFAVVFISPIFLVRLLDVTAYGEYREFILYALLLSMLFGFSINGSLLYFLPKDPLNERKYVTNTIVFIFFTTTLGSVLVLLFESLGYININVISSAYILIYVYFFVNLDLLESYWLAKKRSDYVFIYSIIRVVIRVSAVILTAYLTRSVIKIIYVMIVVEMIRSVLVFIWIIKNRLLVRKLDIRLIKNQLYYILPLGLAGQIFNINQRAGSLFVVSQFGPQMLAIYAIGTFQLPVINIIRSAVSDVIFPDVVKQISSNGKEGLDLWKRSNIFFCFLIFPLFFIFFVNADIFISTLFTDTYIEAAGIFQIMLFIMVRQCFELGIPLRARNKNSQFMLGNILALMINISLLAFSYKLFGIKGPAIALALSDLFLAAYMARKIVILYSLKWSELFIWRSVAKITFSAVIPLPVLILTKHFYVDNLIWVILLSLIYTAIYYILVRRMKLNDVDMFVLRVKSKFGMS